MTSCATLAVSQLAKKCAVKRRLPSAGASPTRKASMAIGFRTGKAAPSSESEPRLPIRLGSKLRTAAKAETMGSARAFRRAADSQPRWPLHSAA
jgi:hypothetical protein